MNYDVRRADWLAGETWLAAPTFPAWSSIDYIVVHWPGVNGVPVSGDPARVLSFVRNQQTYSRTTRGYNLGYSTSADWLGRRIEIRGDVNRNAANAPAALNAVSVSIQVITNLDGTTTPAQDAAVRDLVGQFLARSPRAKVIPHGDGPLYFPGATRTACCGDRLSGRVRRGEFTPATSTPEPPPPLPPPDRTDWPAEGARMTTPPPAPVLRRSVVHPNVPWLQAVLCSMPRLAEHGGGPIFEPAWVGVDRIGSAPQRAQLFGDATHHALAYWQGANNLEADGVYGQATASRMFDARGR